MVQAQNRDRAATDSAAMAEARIVEDRENGSKLRRHFLLKKPNDDTEETMAGKLFRTDATTVRKLYDDRFRQNSFGMTQTCTSWLEKKIGELHHDNTRYDYMS